MSLGSAPTAEPLEKKPKTKSLLNLLFAERTPVVKLLKECVVENDIPQLKKLLSSPYNRRLINRTDENDWTLLMWACFCSNLEAVQLLLKNGASISTGEGTTTPLMCACKAGSAAIVQVLLESKAPVDATNDLGMTALMTASRNGHVECVQHLLDRRANVNTVSKFSKATALHLAIINKHIRVVSMLLDAGADIKLKDNRGESPIILAAVRGSIEIVRLLVKAGADVNSKNNFGATPAMLACNGHYEVLQFLVESGADLQAKDLFGGDVRTYAEMRNDKKAIKLVKKLQNIDSVPERKKMIVQMEQDAEREKALREEEKQVATEMKRMETLRIAEERNWEQIRHQKLADMNSLPQPTPEQLQMQMQAQAQFLQMASQSQKGISPAVSQKAQAQAMFQIQQMRQMNMLGSSKAIA